MTFRLELNDLRFFFSSRRRHTRCSRDWSSDVCSSDLYKDFQEKVRSIPSVQAVAIVNQLPMSEVLANSSFEVEGRQLETGTNIANTQVISPDNFSAVRIPFIRGRALDEHDLNPAPSTVVVNQTLARKIWPDEDAIGKRLRLKSDAPWLTVEIGRASCRERE